MGYSRTRVGFTFTIGIAGALGAFFVCFSPSQSAAQTCDRSLDEFQKTGQVTCGAITWKLFPAHAQKLGNRAFDYLNKYAELASYLSDVTGFEPTPAGVTIIEQCRYGVPQSSDCPNGVMQYNYPMYVLQGTGRMYIKQEFFEGAFFQLATDSAMPLSSSMFHEFGHIYTPVNKQDRAYLWDRALREAVADIFGIFSYTMRTDALQKGHSFYWDGWCIRQGQPELCQHYFKTVHDYLSVGHDRTLKQYVANKGSFDTIFSYPPSNENTHARGGVLTALLGSLYRDASKEGKGAEFHGALRNVFRFYHTQFHMPAAWDVPIDQQSASVIAQKANVFIFLLSFYAQKDFSDKFQEWNFPVARITKQRLFELASRSFDPSLRDQYIQDILAADFSNMKFSSMPLELKLEDVRGERATKISWLRSSVSPGQNIDVYRSESPVQFPYLLISGLASADFTDRDVFEDKKYSYALVARDSQGRESPMTRLLQVTAPQKGNPAATPIPQFVLVGARDITQATARVTWHANMAVSAKIAIGKSGSERSFTTELKDRLSSGVFSLSGLSPNTPYEYTITITDDSQRSVSVNGSFATEPEEQKKPVLKPATPTSKEVSVEETGSGNSIRFTFSNASFVIGELFRIYRSRIAGDRGVRVDEVRANTLMWYDNDLTPGALYYYTVTRVNAEGIESDSLPLTVFISDVQRMGPDRVLLIPQKKNRLSIQWHIPEYIASFSHVAVYRSVDGATWIRRGIGGRSGPFIDSLDQKNKNRYTYSLRIVNEKGHESVNTETYAYAIPAPHLAKVSQKSVKKSLRKSIKKSQPKKKKTKRNV